MFDSNGRSKSSSELCESLSGNLTSLLQTLDGDTVVEALKEWERREAAWFRTGTIAVTPDVRDVIETLARRHGDSIVNFRRACFEERFPGFSPHCLHFIDPSGALRCDVKEAQRALLYIPHSDVEAYIVQQSPMWHRVVSMVKVSTLVLIAWHHGILGSLGIKSVDHIRVIVKRFLGLSSSTSKDGESNWIKEVTPKVLVFLGLAVAVFATHGMVKSSVGALKDKIARMVKNTINSNKISQMVIGVVSTWLKNKQKKVPGTVISNAQNVFNIPQAGPHQNLDLTHFSDGGVKLKISPNGWAQARQSLLSMLPLVAIMVLK